MEMQRRKPFIYKLGLFVWDHAVMRFNSMMRSFQ